MRGGVHRGPSGPLLGNALQVRRIPGFSRVLEPIQGIQGVALYLFGEKLAEGLLVAEALHAYHLSIYCKDWANLAIRRSKGFQVLPHFLPELIAFGYFGFPISIAHKMTAKGNQGLTSS
jgi:hypothetical protein